MCYYLEAWGIQNHFEKIPSQLTTANPGYTNKHETIKKKNNSFASFLLMFCSFDVFQCNELSAVQFYF